MSKTSTVLIHYVVMETYEIPQEIAKQGDLAIEEFISMKQLKPIDSDSRDWEVVDISNNN